MTDRLDLPEQYRRAVEALLREHVPDAEVWAYGSRVNGMSHEGSDLDLVLRAPGLERLGGGYYDLLEAFQESNIPVLIQAHDWAGLPESFHTEIERNYVVVQEGGGGEFSLANAEWVRARLGEICAKIGSGATPRGGKEVYLQEGPYALIRSQNVYNDSFKREGLTYINDQQASALRNVEVLEGDVLLNITGDSVARACQVSSDVLPARVNQHVAIVRPNSSKLEPRYLRYWLVSPEIQAMLLSWAGSGATRNALTKGMIESIEIPLPPLPTQRRIAHALGTLDDKIELNRRMNETLEEMARSLFHDWFVAFGPTRAKAEGREPYLPPEVWSLFPERLVDSELGPIPEGWEVKALGEVVEHLRDNENPQAYPDVMFSHFSIPAFDQGRSPVREHGADIKSTKTRVQPGAILLSRLNPEIERVWLVDVKQNERAVCSTEFLVLRGLPPLERGYVYCLARSRLFREQIESLVTGTSKSHQRAQAGAVLSMQLVIPTEPLIHAFERQTSVLLATSLSHRREIATLTAQRDALLPRLVSGEVRVGAA